MEVNRDGIDFYEMVKQFHAKFGHPVGERPQPLSPERLTIRIAWMIEELKELRLSTDKYQQAREIIDVIYFAVGTLVEMGIPASRLFEIVHCSNMDKLGADGKPHYYVDGKVKKPAHWQGPEEAIRKAIDKT